MDMKLQQTVAIIKPDAVTSGATGAIIDIIEKNGFEILVLEKRLLEKEEAEGFYAIHAHRPFFKELIAFMTSGPIVIMVLEAPDAVAAWRDLIGTTNPADARPGTIRRMFGKNSGENAVHGSDSLETADKEITFLFECCSEEN